LSHPKPFRRSACHGAARQSWGSSRVTRSAPVPPRPWIEFAAVGSDYAYAFDRREIRTSTRGEGGVQFNLNDLTVRRYDGRDDRRVEALTGVSRNGQPTIDDVGRSCLRYSTLR
jgi:hypothetical protein